MHAERSIYLVAVPSLLAVLACSNQGGSSTGDPRSGQGGQSTPSSSAGGSQSPMNTGGAGGFGTNPIGDSSGSFTSVSMGSDRDACCGIKADQSIACWGSVPSYQFLIPAGTFSSVSLGALFACGTRTDGTIACWGYDAPTPPLGAFTSVSVGASSACAVRTDGSMACWGDSTYLKSAAPGGPFTSVSVDGDFACALKIDGTVACWGAPSPTETPVGTFISFSVGFPMMCGVKRSDGTLACFVRGSTGCTQDGIRDCVDSTPPGGTFTSVSAGAYFACGVRTDGTLACWGMATSSVLPEGTYTSVSVGNDDGLCGVRTDGTLACSYTGHGGSGGM